MEIRKDTLVACSWHSQGFLNALGVVEEVVESRGYYRDRNFFIKLVYPRKFKGRGLLEATEASMVPLVQEVDIKRIDEILPQDDTFIEAALLLARHHKELKEIHSSLHQEVKDGYEEDEW